MHTSIKKLLSGVSKQTSILIDFIFPSYCLGCSQSGEYLCVGCKQSVSTHPEICLYTHKYSRGFRLHLDERNNPHCYLDGCVIAFCYEGLIKKIIGNFKYYHRYDLHGFLSHQLQFHVMSNIHLQSLHKENTLITRVPAHRWRRHIVKGYNQSAMLAQSLSKQLGISCIKIVDKVKHTTAQAKLNKHQRINNLEGSFVAKKKTIKKNITTVLIVDDVTTTGSTLNILAQEIQQAHPHVVCRGLVIARSAS